jgi:hypothetical protein
MAVKRKPQVKKLKFELTKSAVAGIAVIAFCLFLWMFLLGVWVGQSVLLPTYLKKDVVAREPVNKNDPLVIHAEKKVVKKNE